MQIMIKPEAADASTQTSQADLEVSSAPSSSLPASAAADPPEAVESRRRRRKKKIIGKAYSKEECDCGDCRASDEDQDDPGLEREKPLVVPVYYGEHGDGTPGSSRVNSAAGDDPLEWERVGEVATTIVCG